MWVTVTDAIILVSLLKVFAVRYRNIWTVTQFLLLCLYIPPHSIKIMNKSNHCDWSVRWWGEGESRLADFLRCICTLATENSLPESFRLVNKLFLRAPKHQVVSCSVRIDIPLVVSNYTGFLSNQQFLRLKTIKHVDWTEDKLFFLKMLAFALQILYLVSRWSTHSFCRKALLVLPDWAPDYYCL